MYPQSYINLYKFLTLCALILYTILIYTCTKESNKMENLNCCSNCKNWKVFLSNDYTGFCQKETENKVIRFSSNTCKDIKKIKLEVLPENSFLSKPKKGDRKSYKIIPSLH